MVKKVLKNILKGIGHAVFWVVITWYFIALLFQDFFFVINSFRWLFG